MKIWTHVLLFNVALLCAYLSGKAQQQLPDTGRYFFQVQNPQNQPLEGVTAELYSAGDSLLRRSALSDREGTVLFTKLPAGRYRLKLTHIGYRPLSSVIALPGDSPKTDFVLQQQTTNDLDGVTVTAQKPFIQRLEDRIVVNVASSLLSAGSSAVDVLERSPWVTFEQNNSISLRGKPGVLVMIDGKPTPMSGHELLNYLRGLPSTAIERIEIITNPSARYEADGTSGIIDIRLKKDQRLGTNGTLSTTYSQGVYASGSASASLNHRNKKLNVFGTLTYGKRQDYNHLIQYRTFFQGALFQGRDQKNNRTVTPATSLNLRIGADFLASLKTTFGAVLTISQGDNQPRVNNRTTIWNKQDIPTSLFTTGANNNNQARNAVFNVNIRHQFTKNSELVADADYGRFRGNARSALATRYYGIDQQPHGATDWLEGNQNGLVILNAAKVDFTSRPNPQSRWEAGLKTSYVTADRDLRFFSVLPAGRIVDSTKTNHFFYNEYNHAGYLIFRKQWQKWSVQAGLRGEQTQIATYQERSKAQWDSSYFQLFPSTFVNYKVKEDQTLGLSISRRIGRPAYGQLNPFLMVSDATFYTTGNPGLLPQLTWSYELNYTYKNLSFVVEYS